MSTYEEFMVLLTIAGLIIAILNYHDRQNKESRKRDSRAERGRVRDVFHTRAVRIPRSVFAL